MNGARKGSRRGSPRVARDAAAAPSRKAPSTPALADLAGTPLGLIMTRQIVCVDAGVGLDALATLFLDRGISGAPVVDAAGTLVGIVSKTDLVRTAREVGLAGDLQETRASPRRDRAEEAELGAGYHVEEMRGTVVGDIMTPVVHALAVTDTVGHAAALMAFRGVHRLPIVSGTGEVVGIVSSMDLLRWLGRVAVPAED